MGKQKKQVVFDDNEEEITLTVNESFKKRFEDQERKRELFYLDSKGLLDQDDESVSSEEESSDEDVENNGKLDEMLKKVMTSIKRKDPKIFDKNAKWFEDGEDDEDENKGKKKSSKRKTFKDVVREQILEDAETLGYAKPNLSDSEDDVKESSKRGFAYDAEQKSLRAAFIDGVEDEEEEGSEVDAGGLLAVKTKEIMIESDESEEEGFEGDSTDKFLHDFLAHKRWKDKIEVVSDGDSIDDDEDLEEVDAMDAFESKFNFRFEEEEANRRAQLDITDQDSNVPPSMRGMLGDASTTMQVRSYSRTEVPGTLRRKDEKRKADRESRKERKANERKKIEEELRRLKNLKKKEVERKLSEIAEMGDIEIDPSMLEGDFDPDQFDAAMQQAFGEEYYSASDAKHGTMVVDDDDEGDDEGEDEEKGKENVNKTKSEDIAWKKTVTQAGADAKKLMAEVQQCDYDDIVDDTPTRFKYTQVEPESFGLSVEEILAADDSLLNSFVSLKKVAAPYGRSTMSVNARKRKKFREGLKLKMAEEPEVVGTAKKRKRRRGKKTGDQASGLYEVAMVDTVGAVDDDRDPDAEKRSEGDSSNTQTKKRNHNKQTKKKKTKEVAGVSSSRMAAYGL